MRSPSSIESSSGNESSPGSARNHQIVAALYCSTIHEGLRHDKPFGPRLGDRLLGLHKTPKK